MNPSKNKNIKEKSSQSESLTLSPNSQSKIKSIPKFWWKNYEKLRSKAPKLISFRRNRYGVGF